MYINIEVKINVKDQAITITFLLVSISFVFYLKTKF